MRGSAANLGNEHVLRACLALKEVFVTGDRDRMEHGPGHYNDLVKACHEVSEYFDRFMEFIRVHIPDDFPEE
eukprot:778001-Pyramimonas_sp.AAC.1